MHTHTHTSTHYVIICWLHTGKTSPCSELSLPLLSSTTACFSNERPSLWCNLSLLFISLGFRPLFAFTFWPADQSCCSSDGLTAREDGFDFGVLLYKHMSLVTPWWPTFSFIPAVTLRVLFPAEAPPAVQQACSGGTTLGRDLLLQVRDTLGQSGAESTGPTSVPTVTFHL